MKAAAAPQPRRIARSTVAVAVLAAAAVGLAVREQQAARAWERMLAASSADRAAYAARDWRREPLQTDPRQSEPAPGDAFELYAAAATAAQAEAVTPKDGPLAAALRAGADEPRPPLEAWREPLELLHQAARAATAKPPADVEQGFSAHVNNLLVMRNLANAACATGRNEIFAGNAAAGVDHQLDALTLGIDLVRSPLLIDQMIGLALCTIVARQGLAEDVLGHLPQAELGRLQDALARADRLLPTHISPSHEALFAAYHLRKVAPSLAESLELPTWRAWRYGFSTQWMVADGWQLLRTHAATMDAAAAAPWPTRKAMFEAAGETARATDNPFLNIVWPNFWSCEHNLRGAVAELRLLRLAVAERLGQPLQLADPFADGDLTRATVDGKVVVASIGKLGDKPIARELLR